MTNLKRKRSPSEKNPEASAVAFNLSFEVSDLIYYYATGNTPTGIQRVQQEICWELLESYSESVVEFVLYDVGQQKWRVLPTEWLRSLITAARSYRSGGKSWNAIYQEFSSRFSTFPLQQFEQGQWLLNVGASWSLASYFVQIRQLRRRGVRFAMFLHDCIPVRHPSYFEHSHTIDFTHWLAHVRETADVIICNSEATRNDYVEFVAPDLLDDLHVCHLDASWISDKASAEADIAASDLLSELGIFEDEFVLSVGTVEPRKNHLTLIHVWDKLRQTHPDRCPKLLCVGRIGWKSDAVTSQAKALGLLNTTVFFAGAISDEILAALYRRCLFTIYVSYYEGWGLPISESLQAGKVCIAGSNSSLLEAGAGIAVHVDERSETNIYDAIARFIDDPATLEEAEKRVQEEYRAKDWKALADQIIEILRTTSPDTRPNVGLPILDMNRLYRFGRSEPVRDFERPLAGEAFCMGHSWHQPESWGNWTSKEVAELGFRISNEFDRPTMFFGLVPPPGGANLTLSLNGKQVQTFHNLMDRKIVRVPLAEASQAESAGNYTPIRVRVSVTRLQNMKDVEGSFDQRQLGAGFLFVVGFDRGALVERLEFLEALITNEL